MYGSGTTLPALSDIAKELAGEREIGEFLRHYVPQRVRFVKLQRNEMFKALLDLYEPLFTNYRFMDMAECFNPPEIYKDNPRRFFAAVYVSAWFHDMYVVNRRAVTQTIFFCDCYFFDPGFQVSEHYDAFLCSLSSAIRPTKIKMFHERALFIPIITDKVNPDAAGQNYFDIDGWVMKTTLFHCLLDIIQRKRVFKIQALSETSLGNPSWLFDWHDNVAYAWFPYEGTSYSTDDAAVAYILGVACTPRLGPCDFDEWQLNDPDSKIPEIPTERGRIRPIMVLSGGRRVHVYEHRSYHFPDAVKNLISVQLNDAASMMSQQEQSSKRRRTSAANLQLSPADAIEHDVCLQPLQQYRIVSYIYHNIVDVDNAVEGFGRTTAFVKFVNGRLKSSCSIGTAAPKIASSSSSLSNRVQNGDFHLLQRYGIDRTRCVNLQRNELFQALVDLYASIFTINWHHFETFVQYNFSSPGNDNYADNPHRFVAAVYVSTWFHDLYVTNSHIVSRAIFNPACRNHYSLLGNINLVSKEYDVFLSLLSRVIRPTIINTIHVDESTLFVPIINDIVNPNALGRNYFDIDGWVMDDVTFHGLLDIFHHQRLFQTQYLCLTPVLGRASWLFDWHNNDKAYTWFPSEGNYTMDDVAIAYILGVACTPRLGPRDFDEWQLMPNNERDSSIPAPTEGRRVRPMVFGEETIVHVYEYRTYHFPAAVKKVICVQVSEDYSEVSLEGLQEYRIVSYVHHGCVVSRVNAKSRSLYFRHIVQPPR